MPPMEVPVPQSVCVSWVEDFENEVITNVAFERGNIRFQHFHFHYTRLAEIWTRAESSHSETGGQQNCGLVSLSIASLVVPASHGGCVPRRI